MKKLELIEINEDFEGQKGIKLFDNLTKEEYIELIKDTGSFKEYINYVLKLNPKTYYTPLNRPKIGEKVRIIWNQSEGEVVECPNKITYTLKQHCKNCSCIENPEEEIKSLRPSMNICIATVKTEEGTYAYSIFDLRPKN